MPIVDLPTGIHIRYEKHGPRSGSHDARPLVLAHGAGVSLEMWRPQVNALSESHRLILWDARGHGGSSVPTDVTSYTMPALAADLRGLLEATGAVDGAIIGGMSFGGQIALQYAVDHPADTYALLLSDTTTRDAAPAAPTGPLGGRMPGGTSAEAWVGEPRVDGRVYAMQTRPDLTPLLATLTMPALVIVGDDDERILDGLPRLIDGLPRRRVARFEGCVHGTSAQRPNDWALEVLRFLADVEAGALLGEDTLV